MKLHPVPTPVTPTPRSEAASDVSARLRGRWRMLACAAWAILRYRLCDIDIITRHTLIYGALTGIAVGMYALVAGLSPLLPRRSDLLFPFLAIGLVAVLARPLRRQLQRGVDRVFRLVPRPAVEVQAVLRATPAASQPAPSAPAERLHAPPVAESPDTHDKRRFDRSSWLVLVGALGYIVACVVYVLLAFQQPTDGWVYNNDLGAPTVAQSNQSGQPSPLRAGDVVLTIDGVPVAQGQVSLQPQPPPPGWRVGGAAHYTVQRDGRQLDLIVPLVARPAAALPRYIWSGASGTSWPLLSNALWFAIGFVVFLLRPRDTAARLLLLIVTYWATYGAILSADTSVTMYFYPAALFWYGIVSNLLWALMLAMATHFVLAFPVRKWPLTRRPRLTLALLYGVPAGGLALGLILVDDAIFLATLFLTMGTIVVALIAVTIHNLRTVRDPVARAQIGWLALGLSVPILGAIILQVVNYLLLNLYAGLMDWVWDNLLALFLPICLGIAITRYRLFDIEIIIRRTLLYGAITVAGFVVYLLLVGGTSLVLQARSDLLAGVIALALVAVGFVPARRRLQALIDRVMPYTPPPEALAEIEARKARAEKKRLEQRPAAEGGDAGLHRRWLVLARAAWVLLAALITLLIVASIPFEYAYYKSICTSTVCATDSKRLTLEGVQALQALGLSAGFYAAYNVMVEVVAALVFAVVAAVIFWRRSDDRMGLFAAFTLLTAGCAIFIASSMAAHAPALWLPAACANYLGQASFVIFFYLFPDGRFVPRWTRWLAAGSSVWWAASIFFPDIPLSFSGPAFLGFVANLVVVQLYRYRRVSTTAQRQQTKWVVYGFAVAIVGFVGAIALHDLVLGSQLSGPLDQMIGTGIITSFLLLIPLSIGVAILRYRLFGIDVIIRRTLIYAVLTGIIVALYAVVVGGLSALLPMQSELPFTIIALGLIALLFQPLRYRLQRGVDRLIPLAPRPAIEAQIISPSPISAASQRPPSAPEQRATTPLAPDEPPSTRLHGRWLAPARAAWLVVALATVGLFLASVPVYFAYLRTACPFDVCANESIDPSTLLALQALGLSRPFLAAYSVALDVVFAAVYVVVAALLFWRRSADRLALFVALALLTFGTATFPFAMESLATTHPVWRLPVAVVHFLGTVSFSLFLYIFPDGRFMPRWTRWVALIWIAWQLPRYWLTDWPNLSTWSTVLNAAIWLGALGAAIYSQVYRYRRVSSAMQRQQTKWVVFGIAAALVGYAGVSLALGQVAPISAGALLAHLIGFAISYLALLFIPLSIGVAILRYRLFDIDLIIRRTLIYGALVGGLALIYFGSITTLQLISVALTGPQSNLVIVATTLAIAALFQPLRRRVQAFVDRRFYREKVDFRQAFTDFAREVRTIIELPELLRALVGRTTDLLHIAHGAVFLRSEEGAFDLAEARNLPSEAGTALPIHTETLDRLEEGIPIALQNEKRFPLLVPLIAPQAGGQGAELRQRLIGVLALGPRLSDQRYGREDQALLMGLADQAGTAIHVAQLIEERRAEAQRREETERQLEARRNSPIGRAETTAQALLADQRTALIELHRLADQAGQSLEAAQLLEYLPRVIGVLEHPGATLLTGFADGFSDLIFSQQSPELLPVGLRGLIDHLELATTDDRRPTTGRTENQEPRTDEAVVGGRWSVVIEGAAEALAIYRLCQRALEAGTIAQIAELEIGNGNLQSLVSNRPTCVFADLARALAELGAVVEAMRAYERVDSSQDKLAYLASAVERLSRADRLAGAELGSVDRPVVERIVGGWLAIVTGAMSELQTRAQLACRLLTRHTWQEDMIALVLAIRNDGRGSALNLSVGLALAPEYTLLDEAVEVERLAAGEEVQVTLRMRPRLTADGGHLRARFLIRYADPRGPDQVEHFADEVRLLVADEPFQFIPNPYVVGTPLQGGSPLFFGRADLLAFIEENLVAAHHNNLVLIGQRRTGKTSLLKQLPARLGDHYLPVYLDGQSLGLDPGLPNFFLALATEIAFALDDRGFNVAPPELSELANSPAATFERVFLPHVREAIGDRHLLLLLDEFEELEGAVRRGSLDSSIFGFLRHIVQHTDNLSVIFCGTHRLEELAADYWSVLFNISLYRHVGFLERGESERLIQEPVAPFGMRYDDLALEKIWRVTAGHPYFLQLLCHSLVNRHNKSGRSYITVADVNAALEEILAAGEAHFVYLWAGSTREERLALIALSRMLPLAGHATPAQIVDYLADRGVTIERRAITEALHHLALRDVLVTAGEGDVTPGDTYRWKLGLLGLWAEKYRSLSRVVDEVRP
jgi:GAF domain-containing protein